MTDLLTLLEKLHAGRIAFSRRFFPVTATLLIAAIYLIPGLGDVLTATAIRPPVLAVFLVFGLALWVTATVQLPHEKRWLCRARQLLDEMHWEDAARVLANPPWLPGFSTRIGQRDALIRLQIASGDLQTANESVRAAEQDVLTKAERQSIHLLKAALLYQAGNHAAFRKALEGISKDSKDTLKKQPERFAYLLLQSHLAELDHTFAIAKSQLEEAIEMATTSIQRAVAYNNLARLEDVQGNDTNARSYYEQAWAALQEHPVPRLYPIIGHNLLIKYGRANEVTKAQALLESYRRAVMPHNAEQQLQLLNDQIHLARQLGDRALLLNAYARCEKELLPNLSEPERFAVSVAELRMRLNDDVNFSEHFNKVIAQFSLQHSLKPEERFHVLNELWVVCQQGMGVLPASQVAMAMQLAVEGLLALEELIDEKLRTIPPALPAQRDHWHGRKLEITKLKIVKAGAQVPQSLLTSLFGLIQERQTIWADKGNAECEMNALIIFCDEYLAYGLGLGPDFLNEYHSKALAALAQAEIIITREWPHSSMNQYALGIAYFLWKIAGDNQKSAMWMGQFESHNLSILHYAEWLRRQYAELKLGL